MKPTSNNESSGARAVNARTILGLLLILTLPLGFAACPGNDSRRGSNTNTVSSPAPSPAQTPTASASLVIDADRAFEHVRKQVEFGPRPAGSAQLARAREYITGELKAYGLNPVLDEWTAKTPVGERRMANITVEFPGQSNDVIVIGSHYDTKLYKKFRFVGANDGASSTAVLMEMARALAASGQKPQLTYRLVFFDGEEAFCEDWEECQNPEGPDNTYGSRHYVQQLMERKELSRVRAMILLDMIGYKNLWLGRDEEMSTGWLMDEVWQTASELGYGKIFVNKEEGVGGDDHEPFLKAGIKSLDIIQLSTYEYWHTPEDTLDKISPQSLKIVGDVVLASLPRIEQRLMREPAH